MKPEVSFKEYYMVLNQNHFEKKDYTNVNHTYAADVIEKLINCESIKLDDTNNESKSIQLNKNNNINVLIISQFEKIKEKQRLPSFEEFNKLLSLAFINNGYTKLVAGTNYWKTIKINPNVTDDDTKKTYLNDNDFNNADIVSVIVDKLKTVGLKDSENGNIKFQLVKTDNIDNIIIDILNDKLKSKNLTLDTFNALLGVKYNTKNVWNKIFKGAFSGYPNGLASKNKGNAFEVQLFTALGGEEGAKESTPLNPTNPKIANGLVKAFTGIDGPWGETGDISKTNTQFIGDKTAVKLTGGANNSRPIKFQGDQPVATIIDSNGKAIEDTLNKSVGKTVADLVMVDKNGKEYCISAKYGKLVSFGNLGIRTNIFPKKWFETGEDKDLPKDGSNLLTIFGINPVKFRNIFTTYETKYNEIRSKNDPNLSLRGNGLSNVYAEFDVSDINKKIKTKPKITSHKTTEVENTSKGKIKNKLVKPKIEDKIVDADGYYYSDPDYDKIINFVKSYVGFGYLLVHKSDSGDITYTNLMEKTDRDNLLGSIKSYAIRYPDNSKSLSAKRLDIEIEFSNLSFEFNIRPTDGISIFPTRIDGTYNITNSAFKNKINDK